MFSSEDYMHDFAIGWVYIMRVLQGFFAIIQPMAFTIISDSIPPNQRAVATSMNNIMYLVGALIVTVTNAWILPNIPGAYPENDDF